MTAEFPPAVDDSEEPQASSDADNAEGALEASSDIETSSTREATTDAETLSPKTDDVAGHLQVELLAD